MKLSALLLAIILPSAAFGDEAPPAKGYIDFPNVRIFYRNPSDKKCPGDPSMPDPHAFLLNGEPEKNHTLENPGGGWAAVQISVKSQYKKCDLEIPQLYPGKKFKAMQTDGFNGSQGGSLTALSILHSKCMDKQEMMGPGKRALVRVYCPGGKRGGDGGTISRKKQPAEQQ